MLDAYMFNTLLNLAIYFDQNKLYGSTHHNLLSQQYNENYRVPLYWWDTFISTVIKRKDYTYAATSGHEEQRSIVLSF